MSIRSVDQRLAPRSVAVFGATVWRNLRSGGFKGPVFAVNPRHAQLDGELAFVSQSGALATAMLDWAKSRGIGFSHMVSLGEHADVDFGDLVDYLASDPATRAILLYIESVTAPRKFMSPPRCSASSAT